MKMTLKITVILLLGALLFSGLNVAEDKPQAGATPVLTESQQAARTLVMEMATLLGEAKKFQVDVLVGYDTLQPSGQKIEFGERRRLSLERPNLLLSEVGESNGGTESVLFDGKSITVSNTSSNVYARAPQPGDIDASVKYFMGTLGMRMPLAIMLTSQFKDELARRMTDIAFVEETDILGEPTAHLAGRTKDVDFQVWISTGKQPVPLRIVLTYRMADGQPQFRANFSKWNFNPSFAHKTFRFEPSAEAREVPFAASFTAAAANGAGAATTSSAGEKP